MIQVSFLVRITGCRSRLLPHRSQLRWGLARLSLVGSHTWYPWPTVPLPAWWPRAPATPREAEMLWSEEGLAEWQEGDQWVGAKGRVGGWRDMAGQQWKRGWVGSIEGCAERGVLGPSQGADGEPGAGNGAPASTGNWRELGSTRTCIWVVYCASPQSAEYSDRICVPELRN